MPNGVRMRRHGGSRLDASCLALLSRLVVAVKSYADCDTFVFGQALKGGVLGAGVVAGDICFACFVHFGHFGHGVLSVVLFPRCHALSITELTESSRVKSDLSKKLTTSHCWSVSTIEAFPKKAALDQASLGR